jgi:hypothetical protein
VQQFVDRLSFDNHARDKIRAQANFRESIVARPGDFGAERGGR